MAPTGDDKSRKWSFGIGRPTYRGPLGSIEDSRRFTIMDATILIAATAVALAIVRPSAIIFVEWAGYLTLAIAALVGWTPTLLFLQLRSPRLSLRQLVRQPGFVANLVSTMILALGLLTYGILVGLRAMRRDMAARSGLPLAPRDPTWWLELAIHFCAAVGPAVLGAWLLLALSGRRRPVRGWLDRLGRITGGLWIALFVARCCTQFAHLYLQR